MLKKFVGIQHCINLFSGRQILFKKEGRIDTNTAIHEGDTMTIFPTSVYCISNTKLYSGQCQFWVTFPSLYLQQWIFSSIPLINTLSAKCRIPFSSAFGSKRLHRCIPRWFSYACRDKKARQMNWSNGCQKIVYLKHSYTDLKDLKCTLKFFV